MNHKPSPHECFIPRTLTYRIFYIAFKSTGNSVFSCCSWPLERRAVFICKWGGRSFPLQQQEPNSQFGYQQPWSLQTSWTSFCALLLDNLHLPLSEDLRTHGTLLLIFGLYAACNIRAACLPQWWSQCLGPLIFAEGMYE